MVQLCLSAEGPRPPIPTIDRAGAGLMAVSRSKAFPESQPRAIWRASGDEAMLSGNSVNCAVLLEGEVLRDC